MVGWQKELELLGADVVILSPVTHPLLSWTKKIGRHLLMSLLLPFILQRFIDRYPLNMILIPGGPGGLFLFKKPKRCGVVALCYHTYAQQSAVVPGERWKRIFVPFERMLCRRADLIVCFADDSLRSLRRVYNCEHATLITQTFDAAAWAPVADSSRDPDVCVCVARLDTRKGIRVLLRAWEDVMAAHPSARLILVGDGLLKPLVDDCCKKEPSIERRSGLSEDRLRMLLSEAAVAICPSYLEGFGYACAEGLANGAAVIASDCDGLRSLVHHEKNGLLVPPGDAKALAASILRLLQHPDRRSSLSLQAQKDMRLRFSQDRTSRELQTALLSVCSPRTYGDPPASSYQAI